MKNIKIGALSLAILLGITSCASSSSTGDLNSSSSEHVEESKTESYIPDFEGEVSSAYEPWVHGYRFVDVLNWSPETDEYAEELRAQVPLQERNEVFSATQVNPSLTTQTQVYNVAMGNYCGTGDLPWNGGQYYDDFSHSLFKFWQYTDYIGAGGRPTSGFDKETSIAYDKNEYGVIGIPIAAFINSAHKNGVKALAEYFIPRNPQYTEEWLYKDENGNFPYAQKLIDMMNYYGFDGYFINQEGDFDSDLIPLFKEMLAWMRSQGCYIQWYDAINKNGSVAYENELNDENKSWLVDTTFGRVSDSMWLNYWWNEQMIKDSVSCAESLGLDPYESLFLGIECSMGGFYGGDLYSVGQCTSPATVKYLDWVLDETNNPQMSLALWGGNFTHSGYQAENNLRYTSGYQWAAEERERMWYTSPSENAGNYTTDVKRPDVEVDGDIVWQGLSKYVAERSVIQGTVFHTNFNTGHGMQYFVEGEVSRDVEWSNMNLQDILPTWQWWIESEKGTTLSMDWDYGKKLKNLLPDKSEATLDYTQVGAYNGGSSLVIYGDLEANNRQYIHLYKTDLQVEKTSEISLTFMQNTDENIKLALALVFEDTPNEVTLLPVYDCEKDTVLFINEWVTKTVNLEEYVGKEIAAIGIEVLGEQEVKQYQLNLGQLTVSDKKDYAPEKPENFVVENAFDVTGELFVSWDMEDYEVVKSYHIYAIYADGSEKFVTGAYADCMYISQLENREDAIALKICAVGADGTESDATTVNITTENQVFDVETSCEDGKLYVSWSEPEIVYETVELTLDWWYSDRVNPETMTVKKGTNKAVFDIGVEDGAKYILTLTTKKDGTNNVDANIVSYFGELKDLYCEPYDGEVRVASNGRNFALTLPKEDDWYVLHVTVGTEVIRLARHWGDAAQNIRLPKNVTEITVVTEDRDGNKSEAVTISLDNE